MRDLERLLAAAQADWRLPSVSAGLLRDGEIVWKRALGIKPKVPTYNILIIGATNQAQTLDPALLRPGRFDRKVHVGIPAGDGRKDILGYYLAKVPHEDMDMEKLANATLGYSPARIKNVINEALIIAQQDGRERLTYEDFYQAKLIDEIGLKEPATYTPWEKEMTAIHESGHAVATWFLQPGDKSGSGQPSISTPLSVPQATLPAETPPPAPSASTP